MDFKRAEEICLEARPSSEEAIIRCANEAQIEALKWAYHLVNSSAYCDPEEELLTSLEQQINLLGGIL